VLVVAGALRRLSGVLVDVTATSSTSFVQFRSNPDSPTLLKPHPHVLRMPPRGESHSLVVHELWVLVVAGSNPASPTR
jgi:hypothetical protein